MQQTALCFSYHSISLSHLSVKVTCAVAEDSIPRQCDNVTRCMERLTAPACIADQYACARAEELLALARHSRLAINRQPLQTA